MSDTIAVLRAIQVAAHSHSHTRRDDGTPSLLHPIDVSRILADHAHTRPEHLISGLLHDVPEDSTTSVAEIESQFGSNVAHIVRAVTKTPLTADYWIQVFRGGRDAQLLKLADCIANLSSLETSRPWSTDRTKKFLSDCKLHLIVSGGADRALALSLAAAIARVERIMEGGRG